MTTKLVLFLGTRVLRGRGGTARYLRGAVVGIALSLVPLIVVMEVSTGMIEGITARLLEVGTYHLQVSLPPATDEETLEEISRAIAADAEVLAAVPERQGTGLVSSGRAAAGVTIRFVPPDVFTRDPGFGAFVSIREGSADLKGEAILLSIALAGSLGVRTGDTVNVLTTWAGSVSGPPRLARFSVAGLYETGYQELDKSLAFAPLASAAGILSPRSSRTLVGVKVRDPFGDLAPVAARISNLAGRDTRIATWRELEYARLASFRTTKDLLLFIMALIVVVASVNVSSSVLMIVFERRGDIAILKSVGAKPRTLALSFLAAGALTGLIGTALGVVFGLLVAVNINGVIKGLEQGVNAVLSLASLVRSSLEPSVPAISHFTLFNSAFYLESIPIRIDPAEVTAAASAALLLSAIASFFPAARAARAKPLEILRKV